MKTKFAAVTAAAVTAVLTLSGCATTAPSTSAAATGSPTEKVWDPETWTPTEKIERRMTEADERERWYESQLARNAAFLGISNPPAVTRRGWATTRQEQARWSAQCMTERGVPATYNEVMVGVTYDTPPPSQEAAVKLVSWTCDALFPIDPSLDQEFSDAQLRLLYDYWDQYAIPCLEDHGITVDTSQRPSKETWLAAFNTPERISWWPVQDSIMGLTDARSAEVSEACPVQPPDSMLFGYSE